LAPIAALVHESFLLFMQIVLSRFSEDIFTLNYWARSLKQIVETKNLSLSDSQSTADAKRLSDLNDSTLQLLAQMMI
jgi:hypothetical protein